MIGSRAIAVLGLALATLPASSGLAVTAYKEPLARVEDELCPGIMGLRPAAALQVIDGINANARQVGIRLANPDTCQPNLLIVFVDDALKAMNGFIDTQPRLFKDASANDLRRLRSDPGPVHVWNVVQTRTRDGMAATGGESVVDIAQVRVWAAHSRIYTPTREDIVTTVALFDNAAVADMSPKQLADYISMRAFAADFSSFGAARSDSILTLFDDGGARPDGLTRADSAFLDSLYKGIPNLPGNVRERSIEKEAGG